MDMVEQVSRAIEDAWCLDPELPPIEFTRAERHMLARAAIAAMREPTQTQLDAVSGTDEQDQDAKWIWSNMIRAALGD